MLFSQRQLGHASSVPIVECNGPALMECDWSGHGAAALMTEPLRLQTIRATACVVSLTGVPGIVRIALGSSGLIIRH